MGARRRRCDGVTCAPGPVPRGRCVSPFLFGARVRSANGGLFAPAEPRTACTRVSVRSESGMPFHRRTIWLDLGPRRFTINALRFLGPRRRR